MNAPRFRRVLTGQVWRMQKDPGDKALHPVLTGKVDDVSPDTVAIIWMEDGAIQPREGARAIRYNRADINFVERVK